MASSSSSNRYDANTARYLGSNKDSIELRELEGLIHEKDMIIEHLRSLLSPEQVRLLDTMEVRRRIDSTARYDTHHTNSEIRAENEFSNVRDQGVDDNAGESASLKRPYQHDLSTNLPTYSTSGRQIKQNLHDSDNQNSSYIPQSSLKPRITRSRSADDFLLLESSFLKPNISPNPNKPKTVQLANQTSPIMQPISSPSDNLEKSFLPPPEKSSSPVYTSPRTGRSSGDTFGLDLTLHEYSSSSQGKSPQTRRSKVEDIGSFQYERLSAEISPRGKSGSDFTSFFGTTNSRYRVDRKKEQLAIDVTEINNSRKTQKVASSTSPQDIARKTSRRAQDDLILWDLPEFDAETEPSSKDRSSVISLNIPENISSSDRERDNRVLKVKGSDDKRISIIHSNVPSPHSPKSKALSEPKKSNTPDTIVFRYASPVPLNIRTSFSTVNSVTNIPISTQVPDLNPRKGAQERTNYPIFSLEEKVDDMNEDRIDNLCEQVAALQGLLAVQEDIEGVLGKEIRDLRDIVGGQRLLLDEWKKRLCSTHALKPDFNLEEEIDYFVKIFKLERINQRTNIEKPSQSIPTNTKQKTKPSNQDHEKENRAHLLLPQLDERGISPTGTDDITVNRGITKYVLDKRPITHKKSSKNITDINEVPPDDTISRVVKEQVSNNPPSTGQVASLPQQKVLMTSKEIDTIGSGPMTATTIATNLSFTPKDYYAKDKKMWGEEVDHIIDQMFKMADEETVLDAKSQGKRPTLELTTNLPVVSNKQKMGESLATGKPKPYENPKSFLTKKSSIPTVPETLIVDKKQPPSSRSESPRASMQKVVSKPSGQEIAAATKGIQKKKGVKGAVSHPLSKKMTGTLLQDEIQRMLNKILDDQKKQHQWR